MYIPRQQRENRYADRFWPRGRRERYIGITSEYRRVCRVMTITYLIWHRVVLQHPPDRRAGIVYRVSNVKTVTRRDLEMTSFYLSGLRHSCPVPHGGDLCIKVKNFLCHAYYHIPLQ